MSLTKEELDLRFEPYSGDGCAQELMEHVEPMFKDIAVALDENINDCRELSLALTKLEEAYLWACSATKNMPMDWPTFAETEERHLLCEDDRAKLDRVIAILNDRWAELRDSGAICQATNYHDAIVWLREIANKKA